MRVLVTGSAGFTGGHLVRTLAARGYQVRGFQRRPTPPSELALAPGVEVITGDLRDRSALERAVSDVEVVYHVAAIYRQAGLAGHWLVYPEAGHTFNVSWIIDMFERNRESPPPQPPAKPFYPNFHFLNLQSSAGSEVPA